MPVVPALFLLFPLVVLVVGIVLLRRQKRMFAEHPERRPYGKRLLLRTSPFIAIVAGDLVYGIATRSVGWAILGIVGLASFGHGISTHWTPPTERPDDE